MKNIQSIADTKNQPNVIYNVNQIDKIINKIENNINLLPIEKQQLQEVLTDQSNIELQSKYFTKITQLLIEDNPVVKRNITQLLVDVSESYVMFPKETILALEENIYRNVDNTCKILNNLASKQKLPESTTKKMVECINSKYIGNSQKEVLRSILLSSKSLLNPETDRQLLNIIESTKMPIKRPIGLAIPTTNISNAYELEQLLSSGSQIAINNALNVILGKLQKNQDIDGSIIKVLECGILQGQVKSNTAYNTLNLAIIKKQHQEITDSTLQILGEKLINVNANTPNDISIYNNILYTFNTIISCYHNNIIDYPYIGYGIKLALLLNNDKFNISIAQNFEMLSSQFELKAEFQELIASNLLDIDNKINKVVLKGFNNLANRNPYYITGVIQYITKTIINSIDREAQFQALQILTNVAQSGINIDIDSLSERLNNDDLQLSLGIIEIINNVIDNTRNYSHALVTNLFIATKNTQIKDHIYSLISKISQQDINVAMYIVHQFESIDKDVILETKSLLDALAIAIQSHHISLNQKSLEILSEASLQDVNLNLLLAIRICIKNQVYNIEHDNVIIQNLLYHLEYSKNDLLDTAIIALNNLNNHKLYECDNDVIIKLAITANQSTVALDFLEDLAKQNLFFPEEAVECIGIILSKTSDSNQSKKASKILTIITQYQSIENKFLHILEIENRVLKLFNESHRDNILVIKKLIQSGSNITVNVAESLIKLLNTDLSNEVIQIFTTVIGNNRPLDSSIISVLADQLQNELTNIDYINLFCTLITAGYELPQLKTTLLEKALQSQDVDVQENIIHSLSLLSIRGKELNNNTIIYLNNIINDINSRDLLKQKAIKAISHTNLTQELFDQITANVQVLLIVNTEDIICTLTNMYKMCCIKGLKIPRIQSNALVKFLDKTQNQQIIANIIASLEGFDIDQETKNFLQNKVDVSNLINDSISIDKQYKSLDNIYEYSKTNILSIDSINTIKGCLYNTNFNNTSILILSNEIILGVEIILSDSEQECVANNFYPNQTQEIIYASLALLKQDHISQNSITKLYNLAIEDASYTNIVCNFLEELNIELNDDLQDLFKQNRLELDYQQKIFFLQDLAIQGRELSKDSLLFLDKNLENEEVLKTLVHVIKNDQVISKNATYKLLHSNLQHTTLAAIANSTNTYDNDIIQESLSSENIRELVEVIYNLLNKGYMLNVNDQIEQLLFNDHYALSNHAFNILKLQIVNNNYIPNDLFFEKLVLNLNECSLASQSNYVEKLLSENDIKLVLLIIDDPLIKSKITTEIIDTIPVLLWRRQCLCNELTDGNDQEFYAHLSTLEAYYDFDEFSESRDLILQKLISIKQQYDFDNEHINQLLQLLTIKNLPNFDYYAPENLNQLKMLWAKDRLQCMSDMLIVTDEIALEFQRSFEALEWSLNDINNLSFANIQNFKQLRDFLSFVKNNQIAKITISDVINQGVYDLENIQQKLQQQIIDKTFQNTPCVTKHSKDLIELDWTNDQIAKTIESTANEDDANEIFELIKQYQIKQEDISNVLQSTDAQKLKDQIFMHVIDQKFASNVLEKDQHTILQEILNLNQDNRLIYNFINLLQQQDIFSKIQNTEFDASSIIQNTVPINQLDENEIKNWAKIVRNSDISFKQDFIPELIAVIKRANFLCTGYELRHVQIISILGLNDKNDGGRILQILTGEGKSTITACFAIIKVLQGHNVDIITSSPVLAKRDANEQEQFFGMFDISVSSNVQDNMNESGFKECYSKDIIYGSISDFQFDLLKHEHKKLGTKGDRKFDIALVDEVDSMLIDEGAKVAKLSTNIPCMEYLKPVYTAMWKYLDSIENGLPSDIEHRSEVVTDMLSKYCADLIMTDKVLVPSHLKTFAHNQITLWARSAQQAMIKQENIDYVIRKDSNSGEQTITPVNYANTGIVQLSTTWTNGLHQFLQIKHGLNITPENLTSSFISNLGYFKRYDGKIYGMTGTLGSKKSQELLQSTYPIDTIFIPPYKHKQFLELPGTLCTGREHWVSEMIYSITSEAKRNRGILVICETIQDTIDVYSKLESQYPKHQIKLYTRSDIQQLEDDAIDSGQIIIATNLAGRGTDIKTTTSVEDNGGLHVCLGFLPSNIRVEEQAFGRTARQGKRGTAQLIIDQYHESKKLTGDIDHIPDSIEEFKELRNYTETQRLIDIENNTIHKVYMEDYLFELFNREYQLLAEIDKNKLQQITESFGIWFNQYVNNEKHTSEFEARVIEDFGRFISEIKSEYNNGYYVIKNPAYLNTLALKLDSAEAIQALEHAIVLDDIYNFGSHYNIAASIIQESRKSTQVNTAAANKAMQSLMIAKSNIETYIIPQIESMQIVLSMGTPKIGLTSEQYLSSPLLKSLSTKLDLLKTHVQYINRAINTLECSEGKITSLKPPELLHNVYENDIPEADILEIYNFGIQHVFEFEVKKPVLAIGSILAVNVLGAVQVVVGVLIAAGSGGFASSFGSSLIYEGLHDIYSGMKAAFKGQNIDLEQYFSDKALSLAINVVGSGISAGLSKGVNTGTQAVGRQSAQEMSKHSIMGITKEGLKDIGKNVASIAIREQVVDFATASITRGLKQYKKGEAKEIEQEIKYIFNDPELSEALDYILAISSAFPNYGLMHELNSITTKLVNEDKREILSIGKRFLSAASSSSSYASTINLVTQIASSVNDISEMNELSNKICLKLKSKVLGLRDKFSAKNIIINELQKRTGDYFAGEEIANMLQEQGVIDGRYFNDSKVGFVAGMDFVSKMSRARPIELPDLRQEQETEVSNIQDIDLGRHTKHFIHVSNIAKRISKSMSTDHSTQRSEIISNIASSTADQMMHLLEHGVTRSAMQMSVNYSADNVERAIDRCIKEIDWQEARTFSQEFIEDIPQAVHELQIQRKLEAIEEQKHYGIAAGDDIPKFDENIKYGLEHLINKIKTTFKQKQDNAEITRLHLAKSVDEIIQNIQSIHDGKGRLPLKFAADFNEVVGGIGRESLWQITNVLNTFMPDTMLMISRATSYVSQKISTAVQYTIPEDVRNAIHSQYEDYMKTFPTENQRFTMELAAGMLLGEMTIKGLQLAIIPRSNLSTVTNTCNNIHALPKTSAKKIHKNSLLYEGETHVYAIIDPKAKNLAERIFKYGESAAGYDKYGNSKRAMVQIKQLRKKTGKDFEHKIIKKLPNKRKGRGLEKSLIEEHKEKYGKDSLKGNKVNR